MEFCIFLSLDIKKKCIILISINKDPYKPVIKACLQLFGLSFKYAIKSFWMKSHARKCINLYVIINSKVQYFQNQLSKTMLVTLPFESIGVVPLNLLYDFQMLVFKKPSKVSQSLIRWCLI